MAPRKRNKKYWFTVEGETEQWYLDRLKQLINAEDASTHTVVIERKIEKRPQRYAKTVNNTTKIEITHWFDYESNEHAHVTQFRNVLGELKQSSTLGKKIKYHLGYSNLTFELWMVLHKMDCNAFLAHRDRYLRFINQAYGENFTELSTYKEKSHFQRVLDKISLEDVRDAVRRAKGIMRRLEENGNRPLEHLGYKYYPDNPSLSIHESVEKILKDCGLL